MIDWTTVIVAIFTFAGVVVTNHSANKKMADQVKTLEKHQAENQAAHKKTAEQVEKLTGQVSELSDQQKKMQEHQDKNYLGILRLEIMSEEMPVSERIIAGKEYLDHGGNGDVSKFYKQFVKDHTSKEVIQHEE